MMERRLELHEKLCEILGSSQVYYQPPESVKMQYPAIVYSRDTIENRHANNKVYKQEDKYTVTLIDRDPDSELVRKISLIPLCRHTRHFATDGLNHDVFSLYY